MIQWLICIKAGGRYYMDVSIPFILRWAAACCKDITSLIARDLISKDLMATSYINNVVGVAASEQQAPAAL